MTWNHYHVAHSISDALSALRNAPGPACPVGGGTDLLLEMQQGHRPCVDTLVDLTRIPELGRLEVQDDRLFIGAGVPVSKLALDPLIQQHAMAVREACALIGGPQVRNSATLGGNVAHALPAADGMISLVAMDAQAVVASIDGVEQRPMLNLFRGPGQTALELDREFLVGFTIGLRQAREGCGFSRIMRPQGVALPILNMAVWIRRAGERISDLRIAVGPAGPRPQRAQQVEDALRGEVYSAEILEKGAQIMRSSMRFRSSAQRASAEYRFHLCGGLFLEVLQKAWQRSYETAGE